MPMILNNIKFLKSGKRAFCRARPALLVALAFVAVGAFSEEWRPRHALVPPTGVMNLPSVPGPQEVLIPGPDDPSVGAAWLDTWKAWRQDRRTRGRYDGSEYTRPELAWTQKVFSQVQMLIWERDFYDPEKGEYTVDRFLSEVQGRIGPVDAVLIWPLYPNLGVDDRNQFDMLRDMPGGIPEIRRMIEQFHRRGVKVFFPTLAWDVGTRDEGTSVPQALATLMQQIGADGVNFDTLEDVPQAFQLDSR